MISALAGLLHKLRDDLLVAADALQRGDELEAASILVKSIDETRAELEQLRTA